MAGVKVFIATFLLVLSTNGFFPLIGVSLRNNQQNFLSEIRESFRLARYKRSVTLSHLTSPVIFCHASCHQPHKKTLAKGGQDGCH
jgi:hypothetical protein